MDAGDDETRGWCVEYHCARIVSILNHKEGSEYSEKGNNTGQDTLGACETCS